MNDKLNHEYEAPALFELGEAKTLTKGVNGEDKMDVLIGGWRVVPGAVHEDIDE